MATVSLKSGLPLLYIVMLTLAVVKGQKQVRFLLLTETSQVRTNKLILFAIWIC